MRTIDARLDLAWPFDQPIDDGDDDFQLGRKWWTRKRGWKKVAAFGRLVGEMAAYLPCAVSFSDQSEAQSISQNNNQNNNILSKRSNRAN